MWVKDPHAWRADTKMPTFRLTDEEVQAISAFLWQSGLNATLPAPGCTSSELANCPANHSTSIKSAGTRATKNGIAMSTFALG